MVDKELLKKLETIEETQEKILRELMRQGNSMRKDQIQIKKEGVNIEKDEKDIKKMEKNMKKLLKQKIVKRRFDDILEWKQFIWDNCRYKKQVEGKSEVDYICKKMDKACNFINCPQNLY